MGGGDKCYKKSVLKKDVLTHLALKDLLSGARTRCIYCFSKAGCCNYAIVQVEFSLPMLQRYWNELSYPR